MSRFSSFITQNAPPPVEQDDEIDLAQLFGTLWRGKWIICACAFVATLLGGFDAYFLETPTYRATSTVVLDQSGSGELTDSNFDTGLSIDFYTFNTQTRILTSHLLAQKVVLSAGLLDDPDFNLYLQGSDLVESEDEPPTDTEILEATIGAVLGAISVSNARDSYVYDITAETGNPESAARLATAWAETYVRDQREAKLEELAEASHWLSKEAGELQARLEKARRKVSEFTTDTDLVSPESLVGLNRKLKSTRGRIETLGRENEDLSALSTQLEAAISNKDWARASDILNDPTARQMLPSGTRLGIASAATLEGATTVVLARLAHKSTQTDTQLLGLRRAQEDYERQISEQSEDLHQLEDLQSDLDITRAAYEFFIYRQKEISSQSGYQKSDSRVLAPAIVPNAPSTPRKQRILALSFVIGLMVGAGIVLLQAMLENDFKSEDDLEAQTGRTVMGKVPEIPAVDREGVLDYLASKPLSRAAEAIRNLRASLLLTRIDSPPEVVLITSSVPGEGKTTHALALAWSQASISKKVLLVECDIRRRALSHYFAVTPKHGLVSVVTGKVTIEDAVYQDERLGCDILFGDAPKINAADFFSSERFKDFLTDMRDRYDMVILDTPPVLIVSDARVIAPLADAILYAVQWGKTRRNTVLSGLRMIESSGRKVDGLFLTRVDVRMAAQRGEASDVSYNAQSNPYYTD